MGSFCTGATMTDKSYEEGLREGQLHAHEQRIEQAHKRLDGHDTRLTAQERIVYAALGAWGFVTIWPTLKAMIGS